MQLSQPTLEPHSLCYTCWVQVVYSLLPTLLFSLLGHSTAVQFLPTRGSSPGATRSTRTSRRSSPSRRPYGAQLSRGFVYVLRFRILCTRHFVIIVINNICIVICAVIYYSFCCIYVWLDPGTYMIARFMSFCKPGVTTCRMAVRPMFCLPWPIAHISQLFSSYHGSFATEWT